MTPDARRRKHQAYSIEREALSVGRGALSRSRVLVLGLGRAGVSVARYLTGLGTAVFGYDDDARAYDKPVVAKLRARGLRITRRPLALQPDMAVASPGVREDNPAVRALRARGVPVVDELDLASQLVRGRIIGVTGTNGKSTTTALIAEMLRADGARVFVGGNLAPGRPLSAALNKVRQDFYVVEVSSFQLERARWFAPWVAVILNIAPDHLDRHRGLGEYARCKRRILRNQQASDWAILNHDDSLVLKAEEGKAQRLYFSTRRRVRGTYLAAGWLWYRGRRVAAAADIRLPGRHNRQNALAALCAARVAGVAPTAIRSALAGFAGLPHRLELVRRLRGVSYINNSMCTNPVAGEKSLQAFDQKVFLIAGGREKGLPLNGYVREMTHRARQVYLIGESGEKLGRMLARRAFAHFQVCWRMSRAVALASKAARPGDVVLFSPGFASFDQYADFQERGRAFRREVGRLG